MEAHLKNARKAIEEGKQKKEMAIKFVIEKLPVPIVLKPIISIMFSSFIDEAIEFAVTYMKRQA